MVPVDDVLATALELAGAIAANAPLAVQAARAVLRASGDLTEAEAIELERFHSGMLARIADAVEGPRAFLEKRAPIFEGR